MCIAGAVQFEVDISVVAFPDREVRRVDRATAIGVGCAERGAETISPHCVVESVDDAIEIFKLNVEYYPNSANVYDSLGDAYQAAGKKEEAIKSYEKALSIDPNYASSQDNLRRLKGQ